MIIFIDDCTNMIIFLDDRQLYDSTPKDELKNFLTNHIFTLEDFRSLDWKITYPKDMAGKEYKE